jgi:hypothetical protein
VEVCCSGAEDETGAVALLEPRVLSSEVLASTVVLELVVSVGGVVDGCGGVLVLASAVMLVVSAGVDVEAWEVVLASADALVVVSVVVSRVEAVEFAVELS